MDLSSFNTIHMNIKYVITYHVTMICNIFPTVTTIFFPFFWESAPFMAIHILGFAVDKYA
jgi:hypothetical protein